MSASDLINQSNSEYYDFIKGFSPNIVQQGILRDAGLDITSPDLYDIMRASVDFVHHAEYYFKDPNDPNLPLILEAWQKHELHYAQYGEAFEQSYQVGFRLTEEAEAVIFNDRGEVVRKPIAINSPRGFGKSIFSSVAACEFALHFPYTQIALFSTSKDQAQDLMEKVRYFIKHSIFAYMIDPKNNSKTEFGLTNGSRIKAFPQSEVTIRGFHPHIKIIDEKARIKREILQSAIRPMGRKSCWLEIGISTPFGMNNDHYRDCMNPKYFHVHLLKPTEVRWVDDKKLENDVAMVGNRVARQEYYGEFLADADTVFSPSLIDRMLNPKLECKEAGEKDQWYILGTDFGKHRDYSAITISHKEKDDRIIIDKIERYLHVSYDVILDRLVELCVIFNVKFIVPDGNGVGVPIMEMLIKKLHQRGLNTMIYKSLIKKASGEKKKKITESGNRTDEEIRYGFIFTNHSKLNITDETLRVMMNNKLECPHHGNTSDESDEVFIYKVLEDEMLGFSFTHTPSGNIVFGADEDGKSHDDVLCSVMLNIWGYRFLDSVRKRKENREKYKPTELLRGGRVPVRTYGRPISPMG